MQRTPMKAQGCHDNLAMSHRCLILASTHNGAPRHFPVLSPTSQLAQAIYTCMLPLLSDQ